MTCPGGTRRGFLTGAAGLSAALGAGGAAAAKTAETATRPDYLPFYGEHQQGIATPQPAASYFVAFDLVTGKRDEVAQLLSAWTDAAAKLTAGQPIAAAEDAAAPPPDSGEARDLPPSRLTLTFGLGPTLFARDGVDRYGLAARRPEAFVDLPRFVGEQLVAERTGGDLAVQACGDDPQATFHAVRQLIRHADGVAKIRWVQSGFLGGHAPGETPRNLMGFKDGTINVDTKSAQALGQFVWVGDEGGAWMKGGSYMVARLVRISLEHWDRMKLGFQEQTVGRQKASGAPLGGKREFEPLNLAAVDKDSNPLIPENAHARLSAPATNDGAQILRRSYSYDNGVSFVAERWPPWRQGLELDAGLLFICHQRDPRTGFIKIFDKLSKFDMMNQFTTHTGGGIFACPGGVAPGRWLAQGLFEA
jgi:deferrochelatase/peroxidase EfeB